MGSTSLVARRSSCTPSARSWRYPRFRRDTPVGDEEVSVVLNLDDSVWHLFKAEAEAQRVTVERLLEHAAIYYLVANTSSGHS